MRKFKLLLFIILFGFTPLLSQSSLVESVDEDEKKYIWVYFEAEKYKILEEYNNAQEAYKECIKLNPNEPSAYYEVAKIYSYFQDWSVAEDYILKASSLDPSNKWYQYFLIDILNFQNKLSPQLEVYSSLIETDPENLFYYLQKIQVLKDLKRYKEALKFIKKIIKDFGLSSEFLIEKTKIYLLQNDFKNADITVKKLVEKFPNNPNHYSEQANVYLHFSKYNEAISIYKNLLQIDPKNTEALITLYKIYTNNQDLENQQKVLLEIARSSEINLTIKRDIFYNLLLNNGVEQYDSFKGIVQAALQFDSADPLLNLILGDISAKEESYNEAVGFYKTALNSFRTTQLGGVQVREDYIYFKLIEIYFQQQKYHNIIETTQEAIEYYPLSARLYYFQSLALINQKRELEATQILLKGVEYVIDDLLLKSEFYSLLGEAFHGLNKNTQSDEAYQKALEFDPDNIFVLNNFSYYLTVREENLNLALEMIIRCNDLTKNSPKASFLDTHAWVLYKLNDFEGALEKIQQAVKLDNNSSTLLDHYGDILYQLGDKLAASQKWTKALQLDPDLDEIKKKLETNE